MKDIQKVLSKWQMDTPGVRRLVYTAENARERELWHAVWLMTQGWTPAQVAKALERDAHTIGEWMDDLEEKGAEGLMFEQSDGSPISPAQEAALKEAVQGTPNAVGIEQAKWTWKAVRQYLKDKFECLLSSRSCLNYLHRLGFVVKRPKKHLTKADAAKRAVFVQDYVILLQEAAKLGAKIFFVDEAHFRADVELQGQWVLRGQPALVDSSSPRMREKATYYSAVCLETGEVLAMPVDGNTTPRPRSSFSPCCANTIPVRSS
jgi:transposase